MPRFGTYTQTGNGALANNAFATLGPFGADQSDRIKGIIFSDQAGSLTIEQSFDGTNWDLVTTYAITASAGRGFSEEVVGNVVRVRFQNTGGSPTGAIRFFANFSSAGAR